MVIVIIRADTKRFTESDAKKLTLKLSRKKIMSKILVILDTLKNFRTGFRNSYTTTGDLFLFFYQIFSGANLIYLNLKPIINYST